MEIGRKLKQLRLGVPLTQEELGERTDLSKGFISQVENDQTSPSIETLIDILTVLDVTPSEFFMGISATPKIVFGKTERVSSAREESKHVDFQLLVPRAVNYELDPALVTIQPGGVTLVDKPHEGEEFGYVISGEVTLHLAGESHRVRRGECFLYEARQQHYLENKGKRPAKLVWVTTPPTH